MLDLGDPVSQAATAAMIILAFVPLAASHRAEQTTPFDLRLTLADSNSLQSEHWSSFPLPPDDPDTTARVMYPYSIIPGGVQNDGELRTAVASDPVVARHYWDFDVAKARKIAVSEDRLVYVSYRIGNSVFWTKRPLRIPRGETLISDGVHFARTRCGNRLSATPMAPVAKTQPAPEALEQPRLPDVAIVETPPLELSFPPAPPAPAEQPPENGVVFVPPIYPIWWSGPPPPGAPRVPVRPPHGPPHIPPAVPPTPVATPEPAVWELLCAGLLALLVAGRKLRRV